MEKEIVGIIVVIVSEWELLENLVTDFKFRHRNSVFDVKSFHILVIL